MVSNRIFLSSPHMGGSEEQYVKDAFEKNWIAPLGANVDEFENQVSRYTGAEAACAVSSGTGAIHLALDVLGVQRGDVVFCSTLTFVASANPILYMGATPVFIDSEMDSWNMSPAALEKALKFHKMTGRLPKAVIVVNLYGQSARMERIMEICNRYGVPVVEDAAESLGATYRGRASGTFGRIGIFSFNGNKIITTSGGGMIISDDELLVKKALKKATQAKESAIHYQHRTIGYNYRLSNICAGIGRGQMEVLDERIKKKREIFEQYVEGLCDISAVDFMPEIEGSFHTRWLSTLTIDPDKTIISPRDVIRHLSAHNIEARPVWKPMHMQPLFDRCAYFEEAEDHSKYLFENGLCLPSDTKMSEEDVERVIRLFRELLPVGKITA
ncbi:DegT/DnrJ/EryC1/StrS family aminotransferase [Lacicoccus alkaliphilus]|nr:DegT/DnrJ/EryC1/StrS family aminotransferase [Salinicoccus alkaliphilus]